MAKNNPPPKKRAKTTGAPAGADLSTEKRSERYYDSSGDVELVSSDGVVLRVHAYHLMSASVVFRDMLTALKGSTPCSRIELTDNTLETEQSLADMFDLITGNTLFTSDVSFSFRRMDALIALVQKYDCPTLVTSLRATLSSMLDDSAYDNTSAIFLWSAQLDDPLLCKRAYAPAAARIWRKTDDPSNSPEERWASVCISGASVLNPTAMSENERLKYPPRYMTALLRAWRFSGAMVGIKGNYQAAADEFYRVLVGKKECESCLGHAETSANYPKSLTHPECFGAVTWAYCIGRKGTYSGAGLCTQTSFSP